MLLIAYMITALELHVFKKVSKTALSNFFPGTTYMVGNIYMHNWITVIFVQDNGETVWQHIFFIRNGEENGKMLWI